MEHRERFGLDKMDAELVNDILPVGINLPKNQKPLLATLVYISGIDTKDEDGFFYVDNKYLMEVLGITEKTLISNTNKLIEAGFIQRIAGKKHHPSKYLVTDLIKNYSKTNTVNYSKTNTVNYSKTNTVNYSKTNTVNYSKTIKNYSQDKEQDKDIDKEKEIDKDKINKDINNIIEKVELREKEICEKIDSRLELKFSEMMRMFEDKLNLIQDASTKTFSTSIETSTNTQKTNTAMNTNELTKIEELQTENAKLNERLDNCARQFKKMMQTIDELQLEVKELKAKLNQDASNQDSSTSSNSSSTDETSTKQEKSDSKPSNESALPTTNQDEEKPTESKETPSKQIEEDVDVDYEYGLFTSAVEACEANNIPYDGFTLLNFKNMVLTDLSKKNASYRVRKEVEFKINNFIQDFNEKNDLKPSNEQSGIVANQENLKPVEAQQMPSTPISESYADAKEEIESSMDGIFVSEPISKQVQVEVY